MIYLLWLLYFIPALLIKLLCYLLFNPLVAVFVTREARTDKVKRLNEPSYTMDREYLIKPLRYFQTHDNAVDEYYWGLFSDSKSYDDYYADTWKMKWVRYKYRVKWLYRNTAYGFLYHWLGREYEDTPITTRTKGTEDSGSTWYELERYKGYYSLQVQLSDGNGKYRSIKIGWKNYKGFPRVMYALRVGLTKKKYK